jgi:cytidine deaminase
MKDMNQLFEKAASTMKNAYAPYSHFLVGACIETTKGNLYSGCNIENASYGLTICAEMCAIAAMIAAGETTITQLAVIVTGPGISAPCGACRQRIHEFATPDTLIHLSDLQGNRATHRAAELLPHAFGPRDLAKS